MKIEIKKNIKDKLFNFYSNKLLKKDNFRVKNIGFRNSKLIGILFQHSNSLNQNYINYFIKEIKKLNKKVSSICYIEEETKDYDYKSISFGYEDISYTGKILDIDIENFLNTEFDYLYYIEFNISPILKYVLSKSKAKCKIGYFSDEFSKCLDLMVSFEKSENDKKNLELLVSELLKYSKIIY